MVAVDRSDREKGAAESIWLARVVDGRLVDRAAGSEDAFAAAVSALIMDRHRDALAPAALATAPAGSPEALEGAIWRA